MITGLVAITPAAGFVNGWGAIWIGLIASTIVWMAIRFVSRAPVFRNVDDTLGVIYTHGFAGLTGGLLVGVFAEPDDGPLPRRRRWRGRPAREGKPLPRRQLDAAALAGRDRAVGDRVQRRS